MGWYFLGTLEKLTESQRMTIANMMGEVGVKTIYFSNLEQEDEPMTVNMI